MGADERIGGDGFLCAAIFADDLHTLACEIELIITLGTLRTATAYLPLGIKLFDDVGDDLGDLGIGEDLLALQLIEATKSAFFQKIEKLKLGARKLRLDVIALAHHANIDIRIGARKHEKILRKKEIRADRKIMRCGTKHTRDGEANLAVLAVDHSHFTTAARAFELHHMPRQTKESDGAHNPRSAMRTAISDGRLFGFEYHNFSFLISS